MTTTTTRRLRAALLLAALAAAGCADGPGGGGPPRVGQPAPAYEARTLDGAPATLAALRGRPVLLNVWATWCHPCREEIPDLQRLHEAHADAGLAVVGVSIDVAGQEAAVRAMAEEFGVTYAVWLDPDERVSTTFATIGVPSTFLIGRDGTLLWSHVGPVRADDPTLARLLAEQTSAG